MIRQTKSVVLFCHPFKLLSNFFSVFREPNIMQQPWQTEFVVYRYDGFHGTSCYICDDCPYRSKPNSLGAYRGYYANTNLPISFLFQTDLEVYYRREPMCGRCTRDWTIRNSPFIFVRVSSAASRLQRWWYRKCYEAPHGLLYQRALQSFTRSQEKQIQNK